MKQLLGVFLILLGVALGLYAGVWWALIGGITTIIDQVKLWPNLDALTTAFAVVRILFTGIITIGSSMMLIIPGWSLATSR